MSSPTLPVALTTVCGMLTHSSAELHTSHRLARRHAYVSGCVQDKWEGTSPFTRA